jgi:poly(A) polymerase
MTKPKRDAKDAALFAVQKLREAGHAAVFAGGCVRDMLLGKEPKDYDVATDATPDQVKRLFPRARKVGAQFGVMLLRKYGHDVEVATFRTDSDYADGRHPERVEFRSREEDARRRDFTINGMFYDPIAEQVIDDVGGQEDLKNRIVRTIGPPEARFAEDHLRMLRAVRFAARLGFSIESTTLAAIKQHTHRLPAISAERVYMEFGQMMTEPSRVVAWSLLLETGLRAHLSPDWPADERADAMAGKRLEALPPSPIDESLALAALLPVGAEKLASAICHSLHVSNRLREAVVWLVTSLGKIQADRITEPADLKMLMAHEEWRNLLDLFRADETALQRGSDRYDAFVARADAVPPDQIAPPPLLDGEDLLKMGIPEGPELGRILRAVYRAQLNQAIRTWKEAIALARDLR